MKEIFTSDFWTGLARNAGQNALQAMLQIVLIIVLFVIARAVVFKLVERAMKAIIAKEENGGKPEAVLRARTLAGLLRSVCVYILFFIIGVMILRALGVDPVPLLTTAGVLGLAVGFGAQKLVKDVISGFFILLENQYAVGEKVTICSITGVVEEIGMRTTRIRDEEDNLAIIANGDVTRVINHSRISNKD